VVHVLVHVVVHVVTRVDIDVRYRVTTNGSAKRSVCSRAGAVWQLRCDYVRVDVHVRVDVYVLTNVGLQVFLLYNAQIGELPQANRIHKRGEGGLVDQDEEQQADKAAST
jgi:hypothetical protein